MVLGQVFWVIFFGSLGVLTRYGLDLGVSKVLPSIYPLGIFSINLMGCFLMGLTIGWLPRWGLALAVQEGWTVGFLGGFTTFSAYSAGVFRLFDEGHVGAALLYGAFTPVLCIFLCWMGIRIASLF